MSPKTILVTGAAGAIGRASVGELARRGFGIVVADLNLEACRAVARHITSGGGIARAVELDVTDADSIDAAVAATVELGEFNGVVNCAGVVHLGGIADVSHEIWTRVTSINLTGTFAVCRAAVPHLAAPGGTIVNVASTSGRTASTLTSPAYVASKAGVIGLTMTLAKELAPRGIRVNAVAPGIIDTAMVDSLGADRQDDLIEGIPFGRKGTAKEVASTIAFLATGDSSYVTGQTIAVNGGTFIS
ncbi:SDR family oxidoreductase [Herbiconiux sp. CPCC 203407]|uniref:SDR family oxidoreductase n=1 Tax=Herbiconiux oxytropis TaxID=2970915 RepID=A0AA42BTT1_9MICO|nr:SDR family NAD(P)-dependent oxidoreductase [Herbiconiux oxytropis]MCS5721577.1 SDR family oxidoreductase [Herbiconiux oxytropis]MCS5724654.1 SDR family oxidoreductase [Herbiconiux oxytropis]